MFQRSLKSNLKLHQQTLTDWTGINLNKNVRKFSLSSIFFYIIQAC